MVMGDFGDFRKKEKKKLKKSFLEKKAQKTVFHSTFSPPQVVIIPKGKSKFK